MTMCQIFVTPLEFQQFLATAPQVWGIIDSGRWRNGLTRGVIYSQDQGYRGYYRVMEIIVVVDPSAQTFLWRTLTYLAPIESTHRSYTKTRSALTYAVKHLDVWSRRSIATHRYHALGLQPTFQYTWSSMSSYRPTIQSLMSDYVYLLVHAILRGWCQPIRSTHHQTYSFNDSACLESIQAETRLLSHDFNSALVN